MIDTTRRIVVVWIGIARARERERVSERGGGGKETTVLKTVICFVLNCTNFVAQKGRFHHFMRAALHQSNIITRRELLALLGFISVPPITFIYKIITRRNVPCFGRSPISLIRNRKIAAFFPWTGYADVYVEKRPPRSPIWVQQEWSFMLLKLWLQGVNTCRRFFIQRKLLIFVWVLCFRFIFWSSLIYRRSLSPLWEWAPLKRIIVD